MAGDGRTRRARSIISTSIRLDVVSFPSGAIRRFENITPGDPDAEAILMFVIGGDAPARSSPMQRMGELSEPAYGRPNAKFSGCNLNSGALRPPVPVNHVDRAPGDRIAPSCQAPMWLRCSPAK